MVLYHFTQPGNLLHIAAEGLQPSTRAAHGFMTGGIPVVWLTREQTNIATAGDAVHLAAQGNPECKAGDIKYGGRARLTVTLARHDKRLMRYLDFCGKNGGDVAAIRHILTPGAVQSWWVYVGLIPPHKIDLTVSRATALECLDHHIATHPDIEARAEFVRQRDTVAKLLSTEPGAPMPQR